MAADLTRRSTGFTDAHRELIKLLAEVAVEDFLRESDANSMTETDEHREVAR